MTVGREIAKLVEDAMLSAYITSPRFDDYTIDAVEIAPVGIEDAIDEEVRKVVKQYYKKENSQYNQHVKAYGKFKRQQDSADISELSSMMGDIKGLVTNPTNFMIQMMTKLAPVLGPILIAAAMPLIIETVIEVLTRPGFPLDPRFKRRLEEEWNSQMSRQDQFNSSIGVRNVTIQTKAGWINMNGAGHRSTMKDIREGTGRGVRQGFIGIEDKSIGLGI